MIFVFFQEHYKDERDSVKSICDNGDVSSVSSSGQRETWTGKFDFFLSTLGYAGNSEYQKNNDTFINFKLSSILTFKSDLVKFYLITFCDDYE